MVLEKSRQKELYFIKRSKFTGLDTELPLTVVPMPAVQMPVAPITGTLADDLSLIHI